MYTHFLIIYWDSIFGCSNHDFFVDLKNDFIMIVPQFQRVISPCLQSKIIPNSWPNLSFSLAQLNPPAQLGVLTRRFQKARMKHVVKKKKVND